MYYEPGDYYLEVKAPNYTTWSKKVSVHSGISTEFWNIVLTKNNYNKTSYNNTEEALRFFISPRKNLTAVAKQNEQNFSIDTLDAQNNTTENIFTSNEYVFTNNEKENIEWTPQAHRIIIPAIKKETQKKTYLIADVPSNNLINLQDIARTDDLSHVRWDPKTKNALFYMSGENLYRIDLDAPEEIREVTTSIASYELAASGLYYFRLPEGIVYKTNTDGTDAPTQITLSSPSRMENSNYQITVYDDERITFLNDNNDLYIYNKGEDDDYFQELSKDAKGSQFSDDGKKLLFWTDHEINTYFVRKWEVQPVRTENEIIPITRYSDSISNVQWSRDYEHVIYTVNKQVKFIEIDQRDHRNLMDLFTLSNENSQVTNNNSDGLLYFTDKNNAGKLTINTIEFPEKTTLLQGFFPTTASEPAIQQ